MGNTDTKEMALKALQVDHKQKKQQMIVNWQAWQKGQELKACLQLSPPVPNSSSKASTETELSQNWGRGVLKLVLKV